MSDYNDDCVFCKIVSGEISAHKIWDDENFIAFLSTQPVKTGHTLVIPKKHIPYIFDMEDQHVSDLMVASKKVSHVLKKALKPKSGKMGVMIAGDQVPHTHVHLISMDEGGDLDFSKAKDVSNEELAEIAHQIKQSQ